MQTPWLLNNPEMGVQAIRMRPKEGGKQQKGGITEGRNLQVMCYSAMLIER